MSVAIYPDGTRAVSGSYDSSVRICNTSMGEIEHVLEDRMMSCPLHSLMMGESSCQASVTGQLVFAVPLMGDRSIH